MSLLPRLLDPGSPLSDTRNSEPLAVMVLVEVRGREHAAPSRDTRECGHVDHRDRHGRVGDPASEPRTRSLGSLCDRASTLEDKLQ